MASAAGMSDDNTSEELHTDDAQQPLREFVCSHPLPQSVSVSKGSFLSEDGVIARGDVLTLRARDPTSVTLAFFSESDTKREISVSPDIPLQFLVLPPKGGPETHSDGVEEGESARPVSMVTYPTVADLLLDCPTYFEANSIFEDPYLPGFSVKPGDKFRYVKAVRDSADSKMERLQCRTESGELVCLSSRCKGNFTVLFDEHPYTLQELISLANVPRRLKLSPKNDDAEYEEEEEAKFYSEIPLSFKGVIMMSRPQENIQASHHDNPKTSWSVPLDSSLHVRKFSFSEYEVPVPVMRPVPLASFVHQHEHKFPVHATQFAYSTPSSAVISQYFRDTSEVVVHKTVRSKKLFVKDSKKDHFFAIDDSVGISFVEIPRTLSSIFEMMSLSLGSQVQVLTDVAADFPQPFVLRYGDVLRVTVLETTSWKFKHSSTGDVPIIKCERVVPGKKAQQLKLPYDLDVNLVQLTDPSQLKVTKLDDIISGEEEIPRGNVSVLEGHGGSYGPLPSSFQILQVVTEKELLISPLHTPTISPRIELCVKIPQRHQVLLGLKRKLEFPDGYFIMPSEDHTVSVGIEGVKESDYEELVQAEKYEDVELGHGEGRGGADVDQDDARSVASSCNRSRYAVGTATVSRSVSSEALQRRKKKQRKDHVKRLTQVLNPLNWGRSRVPAPPPLPPASGIIALSLQPSQAQANTYMMEDADPGAPEGTRTYVNQPGKPEEDSEDIYEEVVINPGGRNRSHERRSRLSPDLERAPPIRHTRTRSPNLPVAPERTRKTCSSPDTDNDQSHHHGHRKTSKQRYIDSEENNHHEVKAHKSGKESDKQHESDSSCSSDMLEGQKGCVTYSKDIQTPERRKKEISPESHYDEIPHTPERRRKKELSSESRHQNLQTPERRRKELSSEKGESDSQVPCTPERRRRNKELSASPESYQRVCRPERRRKELSPETSESDSQIPRPLERRRKNKELSPESDSPIPRTPERRRKELSPDHRQNHPTPERRKKELSPATSESDSHILHTPERRRRNKELSQEQHQNHPTPERRRKVLSPESHRQSPGTPERRRKELSPERRKKGFSPESHHQNPHMPERSRTELSSEIRLQSPRTAERTGKNEEGSHSHNINTLERRRRRRLAAKAETLGTPEGQMKTLPSPVNSESESGQSDSPSMQGHSKSHSPTDSSQEASNRAQKSFYNKGMSPESHSSESDSGQRRRLSPDKESTDKSRPTELPSENSGSPRRRRCVKIKSASAPAPERPKRSVDKYNSSERPPKKPQELERKDENSRGVGNKPQKRSTSKDKDWDSKDSCISGNPNDRFTSAQPKESQTSLSSDNSNNSHTSSNPKDHNINELVKLGRPSQQGHWSKEDTIIQDYSGSQSLDTDSKAASQPQHEQNTSTSESSSPRRYKKGDKPPLLPKPVLSPGRTTKTIGKMKLTQPVAPPRRKGPRDGQDN